MEDYPENFWDPVIVKDPEDFWDPVIVKDPETIGESITNDRKIGDLLVDFKNIIPLTLSNILRKGRYIGVRGNGLCGIYSIMVQLIKTNPEIGNMNHDLFMQQITPIMETYYIIGRPLSIDADLLCKIMRSYFEIYFPDVKNPSFAIFSLSDKTIKFDTKRESNFFMSNLFTIVYNYGHFEALVYSEENRENIYLKLQRFI